MDRIRVLIVDDIPQARDGLRSILDAHPDIEVVFRSTVFLDT